MSCFFGSVAGCEGIVSDYVFVVALYSFDI